MTCPATSRARCRFVDLGDAPTAEAFGFDGDVTLGPSRVAGRDITSASMSLLLADGVLGVHRLEAATPLGAVTASGPLALNATAPSDLAYTIRGIPLAQFREQIGEVTGTVDVDGRLFGPHATLRTEGTARFAGVAAGRRAGLRGDVAVQRRPARLGPRAGAPRRPSGADGRAVGDTVLDTADARIGYADDRATFDVNASSGDRRVHAAGTADLSTPGERRITLTAAGLSIGEQTWVLDAARQPTVTLLPNEVRIRDVHFDDGTGQIVEAVGTLALRAPAESSLHVSVRGLDLLPIEELAGQENPEFAGLLNGVARVTGTAEKPDVLGSFAISRGRYRELQFERVAGAVHYDDQRLGVDVAVEQAPGVTMAVNGSVPLALFTSSERPPRTPARPAAARPRSTSTSRARRSASRSSPA